MSDHVSVLLAVLARGRGRGFRLLGSWLVPEAFSQASRASVLSVAVVTKSALACSPFLTHFGVVDAGRYFPAILCEGLHRKSAVTSGVGAAA